MRTLRIRRTHQHSRGRASWLTCSALLVLAAMLVPAPAHADSFVFDSAVHLSNTQQLQPGARIVAIAHHLPAGRELNVEVCDFLTPNFDGCDSLGTITSNSRGAAKTTLRVPGEVIHNTDYGSYPVFCRADGCQVFFTSTDQGQQIWAGSPALHLDGSPATLTADPSRSTARRTFLTGTADGAQGRTVLLTAELCSSRLQITSCSTGGPGRAVIVNPSGRFAGYYPVQSQVNGVDCAGSGEPAPEYTYCQLTAIVLDNHGQPDYSYGDFRQGTPAA